MMKLNTKFLQKNLERWFLQFKRDFPWRQTKDPYCIWVSEIMLQQTKASVVVDYYKRFLTLFPNIQALAEADEDAVLKAWEGLGYYSRARNLQKGAKYICEHFSGNFPKNYQDILTVPGIGSYTAGAISSFAFNLDQPAVDGNVVRVFSRVLSQSWDRTNPKDRKKLEFWIRESIFQNQHTSAAIFNESCIELGALICTPKNPNCLNCPISSICQSFQNNTTEYYPLVKKKKELPQEHYSVLIFETIQKHYIVHKRNTEGLLANLWEFPLVEEEFNQNSLSDWLEIRSIPYHSIQQLPSIKHVFSHKIWLLDVFKIELNDTLQAFYHLSNYRYLNRELYIKESIINYSLSDATDEWAIVDKNNLNNLAFGSAFEKIRQTIK